MRYSTIPPLGGNTQNYPSSGVHSNTCSIITYVDAELKTGLVPPFKFTKIGTQLTVRSMAKVRPNVYIGMLSIVKYGYRNNFEENPTTRKFL